MKIRSLKHIKPQVSPKLIIYWASHPEVFLGNDALKIWAKLQENTHAEVWFQLNCFASLLKSHFGMGALR